MNRIVKHLSILLLLIGSVLRADTFTGITFTQKVGEPGHSDWTHTLILNGVTNRTYKNCVFDGDGVKIDGCATITFDGCTIKHANRTSGNHHALYVGSCNGLTFINSTIEDSNDAGQLYGCQNLNFSNSTIQRVNYGVKGSVGGCKHWIVKGNKIKRDRAMGFEFQYDDDNTDDIYFGNNSYDEAERWNDDNKNGDAKMAFSLPFTKAHHVVIENNHADGLCWLIDAPGQRQSSQNWRGVRIGIECGGQGAIIRNNWIRRLNDAGSLIPGSANCTVGPNLVQDCIEPFNMQGGSAPGNNAFGKNDSSVQLPAAGGWSLVGAVPPGQPAPPDPIPPVIPPATQPKIVDVTVRFDDGSTVVTHP